MKIVALDRDDGRAEVVLGSPEGTTFVILRGAAGKWFDGSVVPLFSPQDSYDNFSIISGSEAAVLSQEALAAVPSPKPIRNH
jgi:hypothetical protein